jgi:hypothetical protein
MIDRYNSANFMKRSSSTASAPRDCCPARFHLACLTVAGQEIAWASAQPAACTANAVPASILNTLCGVFNRFDPAAPSSCSGVTDVDTLASAYQPDTDLTDIDDYTTYVGVGRRVITIPIVDILSAAGPMTVLGFRQFLVDPVQGDVNIPVTDTNGRFAALYIGAPVPLKQGRFDGGCQLTSGPGNVVLHR